MGKLLKRRIGAVYNLQPELDNRVNKILDLVTDIDNVPVDVSGNPTNAALDSSYVSANNLAKVKAQELIKYTDIVNDTVTGGATVPASAESVKNIQTQINNMANGLEYIGTFDASKGTWPSNVGQGNFFKVNVAGTIDGVNLNPGDMIIANKAVEGATTVQDWDIIDNTESPDLLRTRNVNSTDADFTVDPSKLTTRSLILQNIQMAVSAVTIKVAVETLPISGNVITLSHTPVSGVVLMDEAVIEIDATNGIYDTWEGVTVSGKTATLSGASTVQYNGLKAKVSYLWI